MKLRCVEVDYGLASSRKLVDAYQADGRVQYVHRFGHEMPAGLLLDKAFNALLAAFLRGQGGAAGPSTYSIEYAF